MGEIADQVDFENEMSRREPEQAKAGPELDAVVAAASKLVLAFPETIPEDDFEFNIPAYIVSELRDALAALEAVEGDADVA